MIEIFVSVDVETDGPCPGLNSMLSIGAYAFDANGEEYGAFSANLIALSGAFPDADTMEWWDTQPGAWTACRADTVPYVAAMYDFEAWLNNLPGKPVFVAYPAGFDFTFVYYYMHLVLGRCAFGFQALDVKTYAMAMMKTPFKKTTKSSMPKRWFPEDRHTHLALDDAIEQGKLFLAMLRENAGGKSE